MKKLEHIKLIYQKKLNQANMKYTVFIIYILKIIQDMRKANAGSVLQSLKRQIFWREV